MEHLGDRGLDDLSALSLSRSWTVDVLAQPASARTSTPATGRALLRPLRKQPTRQLLPLPHGRSTEAPGPGRSGQHGPGPLTSHGQKGRLRTLEEGEGGPTDTLLFLLSPGCLHLIMTRLLFFSQSLFLVSFSNETWRHRKEKKENHSRKSQHSSLRWDREQREDDCHSEGNAPCPASGGHAGTHVRS